MKKITIKSIIEFRRTDQKRKSDFLKGLLRDKKVKEMDKGGGDYWVSCLSVISNIFHDMNTKRIGDKIALLEDWIEDTEHKGTKVRWQRNIDILHNFEDFDFKDLRPDDIHILKKPTALALIDIDDFPIESKPNFVFWFDNEGFKEIGATWFVAKINGYKKSELGMFTDIIYRYLLANYPEYKINPYYCIAVDLVYAREVRYSQLLSGDVKPLLSSAIFEMRKLLQK